ncbi:MAG: hypothetical protein K9H49_18330 [Bacteroidales bacterium]|nr:hypothetical protein [Bacteroidales bacterium]
MKIVLLNLLMIAGIALNSHAQTSSLVYMGAEDKLVYEKYANQGEDTLVNVIPDFSYAGYMGGGVALPLTESIPVKASLTPSGSENDIPMIQSAINLVSAMPMDENGFRGAVLLKRGLYKLNGSLYINAAGVVLRGESQLPANMGGTELVATSETQHIFINIEGEKLQKVEEPSLDIGSILTSFDYPMIDEWIIADVSYGVVEELNNDSIITFILYSIEGGNFKIYSKENGDSAKIPYLEIIQYSDLLGANDTLKLFPSDDTYVRGLIDMSVNPPANYRDTIHGFDNLIYYKKLEPDVARIGFMKFDMSSVSGNFISAELKLLASREDQYGTNFISYTKDDDWSEATRTWNNTYGNISASKRIITKYVGTGATQFVIEDASSFNVGDDIYVRRTPNQLWCDTLEMSTLSLLDPLEDITNWTPDSYTIDHPRKIVAIMGDTVFIDIPIVDPMQELYGGGEILKNLDYVTIQNSAVENMYITSTYKSDIDEDHGWEAIFISNAENCWVRNVTARYFGYSCVHLNKNASFCTVQDCALLDPKSLTEGGRKYPFPISGGIGNLVQRCYARGGRHSFATHSRLTGPHVFLDCYATDTYADAGPHHRWAAGTLYDNMYAGEIRVQNRWDMGSGHGWAGVQNMFWNCFSYKENFKIESPIGGRNWGIGCLGQNQEGAGFWESYGTPVLPRSLYLSQLKDRLGEQAVLNITTFEQQNGGIWTELAGWAGFVPTSTPDLIDFSAKIRTYPNPVDESVFIDLSQLAKETINIEIYDLHGKLLYNGEGVSGEVIKLTIPQNIKQELVFLKIKGASFSAVKRIAVK